MLVDECVRYKFAAQVNDRTFESLAECLMKGWLRYFGPPRVFLCGQEGALLGDAMGRLCDKFSISRWLAGSDPGHLGRGGKHTSTGLAEKHVELQKLAMLKMHADCLEQGVQASPSDICDECMMAQHTILSYGGVAPATALTGTNPRDLTEFENTSVAARTVEDTDYDIERACRMRLIAKS